MNKVLITGAGVDKTPGIDFPLANKLLTEVSRFINGEGASFEKAIRNALPGLRFDFNRFINNEIENITKKDIEQLKKIVELVSEAEKKIQDESDLSKKRGLVIIRLFEKLVEIKNASHIDDETFQLISEAFGLEFTESDFIIDVHKMSLSETFKLILKVTLKESLTSDGNPIADAIASHMLDIEQLLIQKFLGFYSYNQADVKNYIYISWCLWGYLVWKQNQVLSSFENEKMPFYSKLPQGIDAITLNYTTFLANAGLENVIYFHGGLSEYVRMDTRQLLPINNLELIDLKEFIEEEISSNIDFTSSTVEEQKHVIPSMVPPLKLKPILSHKYIDTWAKAAELVHNSQKVVVIGYSFNSADEHFNDIIRNCVTRKYDIVAPDVLSDAFLKRVEKVFGVPISNFSNTKIQGKNAKTTQYIRLISAYADELDISKLFDE
ncbi:hypothetical protein DN062_18100 [Nitrincola tibetensis]|uniref:SIR2-like domain-containing protein n=1 Tax=Nitrincola tibetensis TaxID=2219697 RepID=A0A364NH47_9GAMM|nr:hypothetical protein [Nitrincola tibetensis]RAU16449.1 hypothetical protein DN062_18100 [Nitrincola tibetensis]